MAAIVDHGVGWCPTFLPQDLLYCVSPALPPLQVFLLFNIGLELSFDRLRSMGKFVFGMGTLQVRCCSQLAAGLIVWQVRG